MTEKIARRGVKVPHEYQADFLSQVSVGECATMSNVIFLDAEDSIENIRGWLISGEQGSLHHGFPALDKNKRFVGMITRKEIEDYKGSVDVKLKEIITSQLVAIFEDNSVREAADMMALYKISWVPVVQREDPFNVIGIISRNDVLKARRKHLEQENLYQKYINFSLIKEKKKEEI